ncbi:MAG: pyridoxamine 5'-phosphate oxidase family protein [Rhodocyclaceae bacterium]
MPSAAPSDRSRVRRLPDRAHYDAETIHAIIDDALVCTVAFQLDGAVHAIPTIHWREGEHLYIHGAKASRMLKALSEHDACVTISLVDGLVYARSAFHHSMNYRSIVAYGRFELVSDAAEKTSVLAHFVDKIAPGRWDTLRPINAKELNATTVLRLPLDEVSAKIRAAGVKDDEEDLSWPVWAGVVPVRPVCAAPEPDAGCESMKVPDGLWRPNDPASRG